VHRDFKPENVLVGRDGRTLVTDFGLAREFALAAQPQPPAPGATPALRSTLTPAGSLAGTPAYMSPEQLRGGGADARSDLFAFCTALYEGVGGRRPYAGSSLDDLRRSAESGALQRPARRFPVWLRRELRRGLDPDPALRPPSMDALLEALESGPSRARRILAVALLLLAIAGLALIERRLRGGPVTAIALAPLRPAGASDATWSTAALGYLLAAELGGDKLVRLAPAAEVIAAWSEAGADAGRLRRRLGAEVAAGTLTAERDGRLRLELSVGSNRFTAAGDTQHLADLASRAAPFLRGALGLPAPPPDQPATPALSAARLLAEGAWLARNVSSARAAESLQKAAALAPDQPRIQLELARVYANLTRAHDSWQAATRALARQDSLLPNERTRARLIGLRAVNDYEGALAAAQAGWNESQADVQLGVELMYLFRKLARYRELLELVDTLVRRELSAAALGTVREAEADAAIRLADYRRGIEAATQARDTARQSGMKTLEGRAVYQLARAVSSQGETERALALYLEAARLAEEAPDSWLIASTQQMAAAIDLQRGDLEKARPLFESAVAIYRKMGDKAGEASALLNLAIVLAQSGERRPAVEMVARSNSLFLETKSTENAVYGIGFAGSLRYRMGDLAGAGAAWQEALELAGNENSVVTVLRYLAILRVTQADYAAAHALIARTRAGPSPSPYDELMVREVETELLLAEGRYEESAREGRETATRFEARGETTDAGSCEALRAEALWRAGKLAEAREALRRSDKLVARSTNELDRTPARIVSAVLEAQKSRGNLDAALATLRKASDFSDQRGRATDSWHARELAAELQLAARQPGARSRLASLARDARAQGFERFARDAEQALARSR
jgi:tetratricopeptide (TPR) repeat protein